LIAIVDTGPLYAAVDEDDRRHASCRDLLHRPGLRIVIPALVIAETTYFVGLRLGPRAEAAFLTGLERIDIEAPAPEDWPRIGELVEQYADFPLGGTDASIVALAERLGTDVVITLDRRHFSAVQPRHCKALRLLPEQ
jgi:predicted nucleic acid-binding protein